MSRIEDSKNEEVKEIAKDLEEIAKIDAIANTEGGKAIVKALLSDLVSCVNTLALGHSTLTMQQFVSLSSEIKSKLDLVKVITKSGKNKQYLEELLEEALLKEAE